MIFSEFSDIVKQTRTVRRFKAGELIEQEFLIEIIDTVRTVSSAMNKQPLRYVVVTEPTLVKEITERAKWASHLTEWQQSESEQPSAYIIFVKDRDFEGYEILDAGIALQTMMLLLTAKGYAGCPLASIDKEHCKELFDLTDTYEVVLGLAVGVADEEVKVVPVETDTNYYRDAAGNHYVPKRSLEQVLLGRY